MIDGQEAAGFIKMIRFLTVQGDVFVDDKRKGIAQKATSGLELSETTGNYLIATTKNSSAQLYAGGRTITLGQLSFMRIAPDGRTWWDRHWETWGHDAKMGSVEKAHYFP